MKKFLTYFSVGVLLVAGIFASVYLSKIPRTYEGQNAAVSVYELQQDPDSFDDYDASGAADAIIQQNLANTHSVNDVTSIVFDFRGYDTMGEAFILLTACAGTAVILSNFMNTEEKKKVKKAKKEEKGND